MKQTLRNLFVILILSTSFLIQSSARPVYHVMTEYNFIPFIYLDSEGKPTGFDIEILNAIAEVEDIEFIYNSTLWGNLFDSLHQGKADLITSAITITPEREQTMRFSIPYYTSQQMALMRSDQQINLPITEQTLALKANTTSDIIIKKQGAQNLQYHNTTFLTIAAVLKGEADAALSDSGVVQYYYVRYQKDFPLRTEIINNDLEYYGFAVQKNNPLLIERINHGLRTIQENGTYQKIYAKYFGEDNKNTVFSQRTRN